jgi:Haem-NO-binding
MMHGFIFATWEKFLLDIYNAGTLAAYRKAIEGSDASIALINRVYDDETLFVGIDAVSEHTDMPVDALLREYGRYFITCNLTTEKCAHLIDSVGSARELLLKMSTAHMQMRKASDNVFPPLFEFETLTNDGLLLSYSSHRRLCPLLRGALEGSAIRCAEQYRISELQCMRNGANACEFEVYFRKMSGVFLPLRGGDNFDERREEQKLLAEIIYHLLPLHGDGFTLSDISLLIHVQLGKNIRPYMILNALSQLNLAGLSIVRETDDMYTRRYMRVKKVVASYDRR